MVTTTITATTRNGRTTTRRHLFLASIRTTPEALLRLIRQRWSMENEWHRAPRDAHLGEVPTATPNAPAWRSSPSCIAA
jgi:hypothetical protein